MRRHYLRVPIFEEAEISVIPKLIYTSKQLRGYSPEQRKCFFNSERKLRFYKIFSRNNCEWECLSKYSPEFLSLNNF